MSRQRQIDLCIYVSVSIHVSAHAHTVALLEAMQGTQIL